MEQGSLIDWARMAELRDEVGADAIDEVIAVFLEEVGELADRLAARPDPARLRDDMHFLKGSALNLGFTRLAQMCAAAEDLAAAGRPEAVDVAAVLACLAQSRTELHAGRPA